MLVTLAQILEATLLGTFIGAFTDWFFAGVLFHAKYQSAPQIWREHAKPGQENRRIAGSIAISILTFGGFAVLYALLDVHSWPRAMGLAVLVWVSCALPLLLTNGLFIRLHPAITFAHSAGWLVKLAVASGSAALLIR